MARLKIAVVAGTFPGWSTTFVLDQVAAALDAGHDVDIFATVPGSSTVNHPDIARLGIRERTRYLRFHHQATDGVARKLKQWQALLSHPVQALKLGALATSVKQLEDCAVFLPRASYDVIHCHFATSAMRVLPALRAQVLRGSLLVTFHGFDVLKRPVPNYAPLFAYDAHYTANTGYLRQQALSLGAPEARVQVHAMGVKPEVYEPAPRSLPAMGGPLRLITVARLVEFKGIEYGLRAVAELRQRGIASHYDVVGAGPLLESLSALARELDIVKHVTFHGAQARDRVVQTMQDADVFLLPGVVDAEGQSEAQGVVLLEAAACGLPVIASRIGGMPEVVEHEVSGFLTQPKAVAEIVERLIQLRDPSLRRRMGSAGRERVLREFDQRVLNARLFELYAHLAGKRASVA